MAARVNMKFVVILSTVLLLTAGAAVTMAYFVLSKSGSDYETWGDAAMAEQDYEKAEQYYGKAVGHDPTNMRWLEKWSESLKLYIPETRGEYNEQYFQHQNVLLAMARVDRTNIDLWRQYLDARYRLAIANRVGRDTYASISEVTDSEALAGFAGLPEEGELWPSLKRYKGLIGERLIASGVVNEDEEHDAIVDDLSTALKASPDDAEVAAALARIALFDSNVAGKADRIDEADALRERAEAILNNFHQTNPDDPISAIMLIHLDAAKVRGDIQLNSQSIEDALATLDRDTAELRTKFESILETIKTNDSGTMSALLPIVISAAENTMDPGGDLHRTREILSSMAAKDPSNALLRLQLANYQLRGAHYRDSIKTLDTIATIEPQSVSLQGVLTFSSRPQAFLNQLEAASELFLQSDPNSPEHDALLQEAEGYLVSLRNELPEGAPRLLKAEGLIAFMNDDLAIAHVKITRYNELTTGFDRSALLLLGEISRRRGQLGSARDAYREVLSVNPNDPRVAIELATIEAALEDWQSALSRTEMVLSIYPDNKQALDLHNRIQIAMGETEADDPVTQALLEARRTLSGTAIAAGNYKATVAILTDAIEKLGPDPRLSIELSNLLIGMGDTDQAILVVEASLAANPDNEFIIRSLKVLTADDPIQAQVQLVEDSGRNELDIALELIRLYNSLGRVDDRSKSLDRAVAAAPDDPRVIDMSFVRAINNGDLDTAAEISDRAIALNTDDAQGMTYRARLLAANKKFDEAALVLTEATQANPTNPTLWRLLGGTQAAAGRNDEALLAYRHALQMRPGDLDTIKSYIRAMISTGDLSGAVEAARQNQRLARLDSEFIELWIDLEARLGNRSFAIDRREQIAQDFPTNRRNRTALAQLYISDSRWDEARKILDELRAEQDTTLLLMLDARWYADRGNIDGARTVFADHIINLDPEDITSEPYIAYGSFMVSRGYSSIGLRALEEAREFQDPTILDADQALGRAYASLGRLEDAIDAWRRIIDADVDTKEQTTRRSLIEALMRMDRADEAKELLGGIPESVVSSDPGLSVLQAEMELSTGNSARATELFDEAVAAFPRKAMVYFARARANAPHPELAQDVLDDLNTAIQLNPNNVAPLVMRASIYSQTGRIEEMNRDMRAASISAPDRNDLRQAVLNELIGRGNDGEAFDFATELIEERPSNIAMMSSIARTFARAELWDRASGVYAMAWKRVKAPDLAPDYIHSLMLQRPAAIGQARQVLADLGDSINKDPRLLVARAEVLARRDDYNGAARDVTSAYNLLRSNPSDLLNWNARARNAYDDDAKYTSYLLAAEGQVDDPEWVALFRAQILSSDRRTSTEGLTVLRRLSQTAKTELVARLAARSIGASLFTTGQVEQAAVEWAAALESFPTDWELHNNLAYALGHDLGRIEEALPHSQSAVEINPKSPDSWDTLGYLQIQTNDLVGAEKSLRTALSLVRGVSLTSLAIRVHLSSLLVKINQPEEALRHLKVAKSIAEMVGSAADPYQDQLQQLSSELNP